MVHMNSAVCFIRHANSIEEVQTLGITVRMRPAPLVIRGKITKLDPQNRSLNSIHSRIPTNDRVVVLFHLAMITEHLNLLLELTIVCYDCASLTKSSEVLS